MLRPERKAAAPAKSYPKVCWKPFHILSVHLAIARGIFDDLSSQDGNLMFKKAVTAHFLFLPWLVGMSLLKAAIGNMNNKLEHQIKIISL